MLSLEPHKVPPTRYWAKCQVLGTVGTLRRVCTRFFVFSSLVLFSILVVLFAIFLRKLHPYLARTILPIRT